MGAGDATVDWSPAALGRAVRVTRTRLGLTVTELARRSGLSQSFLSQVEVGQSDISVGRLIRVAQALGVPITDLLEPPAEPTGRLVRAEDRAELPSPAAGLRLYLLAPSIDSARTQVLGVLEPGAVVRPGNDNPGSEAFVLVIEGAARIVLATGEPMLLEAGDSASYLSDDFRAMESTADAPTEFLWIQAVRRR